jgi:ribonuclease P protein component
MTMGALLMSPAAASVTCRHPPQHRRTRLHYNSCWNRNETHLSSLESPPRSHPRFSRQDENPGRTRGDQCASRQRSQATGRLALGDARRRRRCSRREQSRQSPAVMIRRLRRSVDFERVLRARVCAKSEHFAIHYVPEAAQRWQPRLSSEVDAELSTGSGSIAEVAVDGPPVERSVGAFPVRQPTTDSWIGVVVPKRHARRAVTRTLLKRQMRAAWVVAASSLGCGLWVIRLRAPFGRDQFPSAASDALKAAARGELRTLALTAAERSGLLPAQR